MPFAAATEIMALMELVQIPPVPPVHDEMPSESGPYTVVVVVVRPREVVSKYCFTDAAFVVKASAACGAVTGGVAP